MTDQESTPKAPERVECGPALDPVVRKAIMALVCLGYGLYCAYDAFIAKKYDPVEQMGYYWFNVIAFFVLVPLGLLFAGMIVRMLGRRLVADVDAIGYVGKESIAWADVTKLVIRGKGLMDVHYRSGDADKVLVLDSWKLKSFDDLALLIGEKTEGKPVENQSTK